MKPLLQKIFFFSVYAFAAIGFFLVAGYFAVRFGFTNVKGIVIDQQNRFFGQALAAASPASLASSISPGSPEPELPDWASVPEWQTFKSAIVADSGIIDHVSAITGVPSRLIVAEVAVEQLRLFTSEREVFKQIFEPLKILGSQSQFSWGIAGVKEATAIRIEQNLASTTSPFYPGPQYAHLLDFQTSDQAGERYVRMIDEHDHYWSYLYAALYLKEVETQWKNAGHDISSRPDVLSTLYNIGFDHSVPNAAPQVGGAEIDIGGQKYSFGSLAGEFYRSNELVDLFPRE